MAENQQKSEVAKREEEILAFWKERDIFRKSVEKEAPHGDYVFYDGPPFATGLPHYGHIVASVIKDAVPRYWTMRGYRVPRVWGWDCHGLPIENIVEKELGFKHKKDIKNYGIAKFNERCREEVLRFAHEWEKIIPRIGRWADMEHAYRTMDRSYMESVWWVFKQVYDKGLVYEDYRSMHICPRCETTLSQTEVSEGYRDVKDIAVTVKFELKNPEKIGLSGNVYMLAWTTTPWTLPGNVALAVGKNIEYEVTRVESGETYILAKYALESGGHFQMHPELFYKRTIGKSVKGSDLVGLEYEPPFNYYINDKNLKNRENGWKVYAADFVTADSGTGIAHEAPAFGADDWELLKRENLPFVQHVNFDGTMKQEVTDFAGRSIVPRAKDDPEEVREIDLDIRKFLGDKIFDWEKITHSYPHCWRCDTALLNYATSSWFVSVTKLKERLLEHAKAINWSPEHIKEGRFGKWLEGARDWSISRQRFWASVIPIWVCEKCKKQRVFGSAAELEEASGKKIDDLHKHIVDEITVPCECGGVMRRIPDVLDTWFDSGSMPYASKHYPFENKERFDAVFPAQFIAEGLDQTRAWFYYLHVLSGALFDKNAFQNVIVNGIVLAEDGKKMSKKLQNYPDPMEVVGKYGADALRLYLLSSPVMQAENLNFSEKGVAEWKGVLTRLENVLSFYNLYKGDAAHGSTSDSENILDRWIVARLHRVNVEVTNATQAYNLTAATRPFMGFVDDLSTWYLRRSRDRIKGDDESDKRNALGTTRYVLHEIAKLIAPFAPFMADELWLQLKNNNDVDSVHLATWPEEGWVDEDLLFGMQHFREIASQALQRRANAGIKVRQPLALLQVQYHLPGRDAGALEELLRDEVNVKEIRWSQDIPFVVELDTKITPELEHEGLVREARRAIQESRRAKNLVPQQIAQSSVLTINVSDELRVEDIAQLKVQTRVENIEVKKDSNIPKGSVLGELK
jgi:isoleucyl-tRNA synthetase